MNDAVKITVEVENSGSRIGEEVVQLYVNDIVASITRPVRELKGFKRIALKPGEQKKVNFELHIDDLSFYSKGVIPIVEPGEFMVGVGHSSSDIPLLDKFEVIP